MSNKMQRNYSKELGSLQQQEEQIQKSSIQDEDQFDPHLSKKKKIIFWLYLLCLLAFIISVLALISKAFDPVQKHLSSDYFYFSNQIVSEWNRGFVTDIKVLQATANPTCPIGYQYAFTYQWRGTGFGCLCSSGQNTTFVLQAYCSPALIQSNCTNIGSQISSESHFWANNSNICIKRSSVSFANEKKFDNTNKICGSSQSLVVVPLSEPCPLVNISQTSFGLQSHIYVADDPDKILPDIYGAYNSTSPYSFYSYPVIKFTVSEGEFCQINDDTGVSGNHVDFVLLSVPRGCASEGNYTQIDEITELQFYNNNPALYQLTQIHGFPEAGNWKYKFGFASVGSWTYQCRHNLNGKFSIQKASKQFNFEIYSFLQSGSWVIIVSSIIIAIEIFLLSLRRCVNNSIYPVGYKKQHLPEHFWWAMTRYIVDIICKILIIIFSVLFTLNSYIDWHWFKQVQNNKCHHDNMEMVQNIILPLQKIHLVLFQNSLAIVIISIVMLIVDVYHFYYVYNNQLAYYLVEDNQVLVDKENTLDRVNDLKWLEVDNVQELQPNKNDDQLRITMGQNLFGSDDDVFLPPSRLKKKKKKATNKKLFNNNNKQDAKLSKTPNNDNSGYLFNDDIYNIDNLDEPSSAILNPSVSLKKRQSSIRKKK